MWLESLSLAEDHAEKCPTCGGGVRRRAHSAMHAGSFISDGKRVDIRKRPAADFANPVVLDPLTQYFDGGLYRMWPSERYLSRGGRKLHRDVWTSAFGPVPAGCHIHHRDEDVSNNQLANLQCTPASEHRAHAQKRAIQRRAANGTVVEHFKESARDAAAKWHASDEGRLWHSRHAIRAQSWTKWKREEKHCEACGAAYQALVRANGRQQRYCTNTCKTRAYRDRKHLESNG